MPTLSKSQFLPFTLHTGSVDFSGGPKLSLAEEKTTNDHAKLSPFHVNIGGFNFWRLRNAKTGV
jgi:hypothetical protein